MIPFNPAVFSIFYIAEMLLWITPLFILITLMIVVRIFYVARKEKYSFFQTFFKRKVRAGISIIIFIITAILLVISYDVIKLKRELRALDEGNSERYNEQVRNQQMRRSFVLEHDHLYGEFLFPKGTLVNRYDPSDSGEPTYPLILSGFSAATFAEPTEIAGILATKIENRGLVELAEDQNVGPVYFYATKDGESGWTLDKTTPFMACKKGMVALFEVPSGPGFDINEEFWWKDKDGAEAYFKPSEWQFRYCDNSFTVEVSPAYGLDEAIAIENARLEQKAKEDQKSQTIIKDGVLMDAEPVEFTLSYFLEGMGEYHFGSKREGGKADYSKAYQLFSQAADNGEDDAYYYLGMMNYHGEGTPQNREDALFWFNKAVEAGSNDAIGMIGRIYFEDASIQDYEQALALFKKGAAKGNLTAEFYLGWMSVQGLGVEQDYQQGLEWFKKAAHPLHAVGMTGYDQLAIDAMENIGQIYEKGLLGETDLKSAKIWYEKACLLESMSACEVLIGQKDNVE